MRVALVPRFWVLARFITRLDGSNVLTIHRATLCSKSVLHRYLSSAVAGLRELPAVYYPGPDVDDICCGMTRKSGQCDPVI